MILIPWSPKEEQMRINNDQKTHMKQPNKKELQLRNYHETVCQSSQVAFVCAILIRCKNSLASVLNMLRPVNHFIDNLY